MKAILTSRYDNCGSISCMQLRSEPIVWPLLVCRSVLGVFCYPACSSALETSSGRGKSNTPQKIMVLYLRLLLTDCLRLFVCRTVRRSRECFALILAWTRGRNFRCLPNYCDRPEFLSCSFCQASPFGPEDWVTCIRTGGLDHEHGSWMLLCHKFMITAISPS